MKSFLIIALLLSPLAAGAADFVSLTNIPALTDAASASSLPIFLNNLYKICIGLAAVLAVLQIIRAGIMYMMGDSITEKKEARTLIGLAIMGLLLVLSPVIVFGIINKDILELNLNVKVLAPEKKAETPIDPALEAALRGYASTQAVTLPAGKQCSDTLGADWENTPVPALGQPSTFCSAMTTGQTCCGRKQSTAPASTQTGWSYTIAYKSTDFTKVGSPACVVFETKSASSIVTCVGAYNEAISRNSGKGTETLHECNSTGAVKNPSAQLSALPRCSI